MIMSTVIIIYIVFLYIKVFYVFVIIMFYSSGNLIRPPTTLNKGLYEPSSFCEDHLAEGLFDPCAAGYESNSTSPPKEDVQIDAESPARNQTNTTRIH